MMNVKDALLLTSGLLGGNGHGGGTALIPKTVTANGTYNASDDSADGYSAVTVDVPAGETVYRTPISGRAYEKNEVLNTGPYENLASYDVATRAKYGLSSTAYAYAEHLETFEAHTTASGSAVSLDNTDGYCLFYACSALKRVVLDLPINYFTAHNMFGSCTALETAQVGGIGNPVQNMSGSPFQACTQTGLTITVYTTAETLANLPSTISGAPWGATNATIIYRNSTTGEVLT